MTKQEQQQLTIYMPNEDLIEAVRQFCNPEDVFNEDQ